ncbi:MAG: Cell division protein FtsX [Thermoanaerobaculia bacterium]|nr:Cell division protein FtsX [Thermoanaerobaculia bacterium]
MKTSSATFTLLDEAFSGIWRARRMVLLSVLQIGVSIYLVGVFLLFAENLSGITETVRDESAITVYFRPSSTSVERENLEKFARDSHYVSAVRAVSSAEVRKRFITSWSSLATAATSVEPNPFPDTVELDLLPDALVSRSLPGFLTRLAAQPGVDDVQFDVEWIRRLRGVVTLIQTAGAFLGLILALGAAFTIANVVRLTILLHQDEIEILRLVGAPEFLIRGPFVGGGVVQGFLGALLALGLLALSFHGVIRYVAATKNVLLGVFVVKFLPLGPSLLLVSGGVLAGLLGGLLAVRRRHIHG